MPLLETRGAASAFGFGLNLGAATIVTSNLKIHLDASNPTSYSGSGTTWYDLSGNGNHSSGSFGYSSTAGGTLTFNGSNQRLDGSTSGITGNTARTISAWFTGAAQDRIPFSLGNVTSGNSAFSMVPQTPSGVNIYGLLGTYDETGLSSGVYDLTSGGWFNLTLTWDAGNPGTILVYINGVLEGSRTRSAGAAYSTDDGYVIGNWGNNDRPWSGNVAHILGYDRALTAVEVKQNFDATKTRFGYGTSMWSDALTSNVVYYLNGDTLADKKGRHALTAAGSAGLSSGVATPILENRTTTQVLFAGGNTSSYISVANNLEDFNWSSTDWTVEYWLYDPGSVNDYMHVFVADGQGSKGTFKGGSNSARDYSAYFYSSSGQGLTQLSFPASKWVHISYQRRASDGYGWIHLNGKLMGQGTFSLPGGTPSSALHGFWNAEAADFYFDEFKVTRALRYSGNGFVPPRFASSL